MRSTVTDASQSAVAGVGTRQSNPIRFCFPDTATADAFRNRFGGECLTYALGKPKPRTWATSSDAPAVKREAEEEWGGKKKWR
jgi:hypothetical protein